LDLENHWKMEERPFLGPNVHTPQYDQMHDQLLEKYPIPSDYNIGEIGKFKGFDTTIDVL
jgi:hypothetical protein